MTWELTTVADDEAVAFRGERVRRFTELPPDSVLELDGLEIRTLPRRGELLATVCTVNDVHFGETVAGLVEGSDVGPAFSVAPGEEPYPETMNRAAVSEMAALDPDAVVVKGDLTSTGTLGEYQQFLDVYEPAFGPRLHHVRGNHDSYHGEQFADRPTQEVELEGVTLAILDTARRHRVGGYLSAAQLEWLDELGARADRPVLVFGHHPVWDPGQGTGSGEHFGLQPADSEALFAVMARRHRLAGWFAGHTHRNARLQVASAGPAPLVEVACVKDFPGAWAEYRVFEGGILQVVRRVTAPRALAWAERTRAMFGGTYGPYALGRLSDRCFEVTQ